MFTIDDGFGFGDHKSIDEVKVERLLDESAKRILPPPLNQCPDNGLFNIKMVCSVIELKFPSLACELRIGLNFKLLISS